MVDEVISSLLKEQIIKTHFLSKEAKDLPIRFAFTYGRNGRFGALDAVTAVGSVDITVLERRGGRKDNIRITGRVRHKSLMDDGEKIFPGQSLEDLVLIRRNGSRIGSIDVEAFDWGVIEVIQGPPEAIHVDDAGLFGHEIFPQDLFRGKGP
jgi:hypothetical protein